MHRSFPNAHRACNDRAPGSTDVADLMRHTRRALRELSSSSVARDSGVRRAFPFRIVARARHLVRPPVRQTRKGTVELYGGRTLRPFITPAGTRKHAMTSQAAAMSGLKQETIAIVAVGLTILGTIAVHHEPARIPYRPPPGRDPGRPRSLYPGDPPPDRRTVPPRQHCRRRPHRVGPIAGFFPSPCVLAQRRASFASGGSGKAPAGPEYGRYLRRREGEDGCGTEHAPAASGARRNPGR